MSITDELRKVAAKTECANGRCEKLYRGDLDHIADRIDQEHEECEGFARRLEDAASKGEEVTIFGTDYVPLPTDAEGIPFHVGDHVEVPDGLPSEGKPWQVGTIARLVLGATCWHVRVIAGGMYHDYLVENVRHYHQPTVEDVLRNVVTLCYSTWKEESPFHFYDVDDVMESGNIADFAAKLRLAGDAE